MDAPPSSLAVPSVACRLRSKLLQSRRLPSISVADRVRSSATFPGSRAPTDIEYSSRDGSQASSFAPSGSLYSESYQASQAVATCCTFGWSAVASFNVASSTNCAGPLLRRRAASMRPSGARPSMERT